MEFYLKQFPELEGKTFLEARRLFDDAVLCGYVRREEDGKTKLHINCSDSDVLQESDRVIALSQDGNGPPIYHSTFHMHNVILHAGNQELFNVVLLIWLLRGLKR